MNLTIIIFCYNEKGTLRAVVEAAIRFLETFAERYEVLIIDDGSNDGSIAIAQQLEKENAQTVKVIAHEVNKGIGMALRTGYAAAQMEYVCAIPADGQFEVDLLKSVEPFLNDTYYSFYRRKTHYSFYREALSKFNRLFNQHVLGIFLRDVNWIKVYRKQQLELVKPELTSSIVESEICAKLYKCGVLPTEIPSDYLTRTYGVSKGGGLKTVFRALAETGKLIWVVMRFKP